VRAHARRGRDGESYVVAFSFHHEGPGAGGEGTNNVMQHVRLLQLSTYVCIYTSSNTLRILISTNSCRNICMYIHAIFLGMSTYIPFRGPSLLQEVCMYSYVHVRTCMQSPQVDRIIKEINTKRPMEMQCT
jgi:hypothetical protein